MLAHANFLLFLLFCQNLLCLIVANKTSSIHRTTRLGEASRSPKGGNIYKYN